eukprot:UN03736
MQPSMGVSYVTENKKVLAVGGTALLAYIMYKSFDKKEKVKAPVEGETLQNCSNQRESGSHSGRHFE